MSCHATRRTGRSLFCICVCLPSGKLRLDVLVMLRIFPQKAGRGGGPPGDALKLLWVEVSAKAQPVVVGNLDVTPCSLHNLLGLCAGVRDLNHDLAIKLIHTVGKQLDADLWVDGAAVTQVLHRDHLRSVEAPTRYKVHESTEVQAVKARDEGVLSVGETSLRESLLERSCAADVQAQPMIPRPRLLALVAPPGRLSPPAPCNGGERNGEGVGE